MRAVIVFALLLIAAPASADWRERSRQANDRSYAVMARACDRLTHRCIWTVRYFRNPVWR